MFGVHTISEEVLRSLVHYREGEDKLGATITCFPQDTSADFISRSHQARFVLLGIAEDIGVRANGGIGGTQTAWLSFLKSFLNIQENRFLSGKDFLIRGVAEPVKELAYDRMSLNELRALTAEIDEVVYPLVQEVVAAGKIPIVIGGGHNNAYPIIKGSSLALDRPLNVINLDAHSDFRIAEGRHSGNGFRYAYNGGFMNRYALLGLHEAYNSRNIVSELESNPAFRLLFWEDIFMRRQLDWEEAISRLLPFVNEGPLGVELDVDAIEDTLSSAATPVGIDSRMAMRYLYRCAQSMPVVYLHLPEAIVQRADGLKNEFAGKLLSYLVQAFVKGVQDRV